MTGLKPGHITVQLSGSAGQSIGAFAVQGLKLEVFWQVTMGVGGAESRYSAASSTPRHCHCDVPGRSAEAMPR